MIVRDTMKLGQDDDSGASLIVGTTQQYGDPASSALIWFGLAILAALLFSMKKS